MKKTWLLPLWCFLISVPLSGTADLSPDPPLSLRALLGEFTQADFLPVEQAFQLELSAPDSDGASASTNTSPPLLIASFAIADGYYLYRDKIRFQQTSNNPQNTREITAALPPGEKKQDQYFGEMLVFKRDFSAPLTLPPPQTLKTTPTQLLIRATYQGCAEDGICYAPVTQTFAQSQPGGKFIATSTTQATNPFTTEFAAPSAPSNPTAPTQSALALSAFSILFGAFLAGLLLTFTPCVLPMIPILSGIIAAQSQREKGKPTRTKAPSKSAPALASLAYVLGTIASYAAIGALAGASGAQLQAYFQNIWAIGFLSLVLLTMALSMFGLFQIQLPSTLQTLVTKQGISARASSLPMIFLLGALSALIVGACVSPILISVLGIAIVNGDAWLGARMMSALALGMGIPLLALGIGANYWLPKVGEWTRTVNHLLGVSLIAVAIYLLGNLPQVPVLLLWGIFFIALAIYLFTPRARTRLIWQIAQRTLGVLLLLWGAASLFGNFYAQRDVLRPLPPLTAFTTPTQLTNPTNQSTQEATQAKFTPVHNPTELTQQFARATAENKLIMLEYYADWCVECVRMERGAFRDPRVIAALHRDFLPLRVDVTDPYDRPRAAIKKQFAVFGPPAMLFFDRNGAPIKTAHFYGYRNAAQLHALLNQLAHTH